MSLPSAKRKIASGESELLYHSLVDTLPLCLLRKDSDGVYTFINKRYYEYFDTTTESLVGKTDFDIFPSSVTGRTDIAKATCRS